MIDRVKTELCAFVNTETEETIIKTITFPKFQEAFLYLHGTRNPERPPRLLVCISG